MKNENDVSIYVRIGLIVAVISWVGMGGILAFLWRSLPPQIPWLYSLPWGEGQLVTREVFGAYLGGSFLTWLLTMLLAWKIEKKRDVLWTVINSGGLIISLLYVASFLKVIMIFI